MKINGLWAHNGLSDKGYAYAEALVENEKRAKPRVVKVYRTYEECLPWQLGNNDMGLYLFLGMVFAVLSMFEAKDGKIGMSIFWGVLTLFFLWGGMFSGNSIMNCMRNRNEKKLARANGTQSIGEIVGYKIKVEMHQWRHRGQDCADFSFTYVLEVRFAEGNRNRIIKTPDMRYHPNSVLKSNRCSLYRWNGEYYIADFDLRKKRTDEASAIPFQGVTYAKKW